MWGTPESRPLAHAPLSHRKTACPPGSPPPGRGDTSTHTARPPSRPLGSPLATTPSGGPSPEGRPGLGHLWPPAHSTGLAGVALPESLLNKGHTEDRPQTLLGAEKQPPG